MAITSAFQADDESSILSTRSTTSPWQAEYKETSSLSTLFQMVASMGMRLGFINPGDWSDGLER